MREKGDRKEDEERVREKGDRKEDGERVREKDDRKEDEERVREKDNRKEDEERGKGGEVGMEKKANDTRVCCMLTCFKLLCNTYFWFILIVVLSK